MGGKSIVRSMQENQIKLYNSKQLLMIEKQKWLIERFKHNPNIVEAQIELLYSFRPIITIDKTQKYLDHTIKQLETTYKGYEVELEWNKPTIITRQQAQEYLQMRYGNKQS
jgi:hypothetical protein